MGSSTLDTGGWATAARGLGMRNGIPRALTTVRGSASAGGGKNAHRTPGAVTEQGHLQRLLKGARDVSGTSEPGGVCSRDGSRKPHTRATPAGAYKTDPSALVPASAGT